MNQVHISLGKHRIGDRNSRSWIVPSGNQYRKLPRYFRQIDRRALQPNPRHFLEIEKVGDQCVHAENRAFDAFEGLRDFPFG